MDMEQDAPIHSHTHAPVPEHQQSSTQGPFAQTVAGIDRPGPHAHCQECDKQADLRERRNAARHCCEMTAWTFMMLFICGMILGIFTVYMQRHDVIHAPRP